MFRDLSALFGNELEAVQKNKSLVIGNQCRVKVMKHLQTFQIKLDNHLILHCL